MLLHFYCLPLITGDKTQNASSSDIRTIAKKGGPSKSVKKIRRPKSSINEKRVHHFVTKINKEEVLKQKSYPVEYVPTVLGALKLKVQNSIYKYHVTVNNFKFYVCDSVNLCPSYVAVHKNQVYILHDNHNHNV